MHYLVTGGAGFIGSNIVEKLILKGEKVRILDSFFSGKRENLLFPEHERIEVIEGDIRNLKDCRQAASGIDYVLHHAAIASVPHSVKDPLLTHEVNVTGTINMLIAARDARVRRFVLASSSSVYGNGNCMREPNREEMRTEPLSPYALSKWIGEETCKIFTRLYGLETVALRYFNVFGIRQNPRSEYAAVIPKFIEAVLQKRRPLIYGDGLQSRDFVYVDDVVEANLKACMTPNSVAGKVFNVACGKSCTLLDILDSLSQINEMAIEPVHTSSKAGDIRHSLADISLSKSLLGFEPGTPFYEGLKKTTEWYRAGLRAQQECETICSILKLRSETDAFPDPLQDSKLIENT